jgi:hypothetical protein
MAARHSGIRSQVTLYGDNLCGSTPLSPELEDGFTSCLRG